MTDVLRRRGEEIQTQGRKPGEDRDSDHDNYKPNKYQRLPVTTRTGREARKDPLLEPSEGA